MCHIRAMETIRTVHTAGESWMGCRYKL
jgi:hypothetical protein